MALKLSAWVYAIRRAGCRKTRVVLDYDVSNYLEEIHPGKNFFS
jgi:hypothetical protein